MTALLLALAAFLAMIAWGVWTLHRWSGVAGWIRHHQRHGQIIATERWWRPAGVTLHPGLWIRVYACPCGEEHPR